MTWIYDETAPRRLTDLDDMPLPPLEVLEVMYEYIKMGDLWGLKTQAEQLLEGDQAYQAFVNQVLELVQGFEEKELSKLFEDHLQLREKKVY